MCALKELHNRETSQSRKNEEGGKCTRDEKTEDRKRYYKDKQEHID
jgi:hypothetical protein